MITSVALVSKDKKKRSKPSSSILFDRQKRKLDKLDEKYNKLIQQYEEAYSFYHFEAKKIGNETAEIIARYLLKLDETIKNSKSFKKKEKEMLNEIMRRDYLVITNLISINEVTEEMKEVYNILFGESLDCTRQKIMEEFEREFEGSHTDSISDDDVEDEKDTMEFLSKTKSKKQMQKEEKLKDLESLKNKNFNVIYKRLAKELHPDLEQDPVIRTQKAEMMKRLTSSNENGDLMEILKIESEWLIQCEKNVSAIDEDTLKIYNLILKDQINTLEEKIENMCYHPRFSDMSKYMVNPENLPIENIQQAMNEFQLIKAEYIDNLKKLSGKNPTEFVKSVMKSYRELVEMSEFEKFLYSLFE